MTEQGVIERYCRQFADVKDVSFGQLANGFGFIEIDSPQCSGKVYLQGAHLAEFRRKTSAKPLLFLSQQAWLEDGKPIRGGVPICFPWFGGRSDAPHLPAHGTARITPWKLRAIENASNGLRLTFQWQSDGWALVYSLVLGDQLQLELEVTNASFQKQTFEAALHTYFLIADSSKAFLTGLEKATYLDQLTGKDCDAEERAIEFREETDRIYAGTHAQIVLEDPVWKRRIVICPKGSQSTVVWNPWIAKSQRMPDFGDEEYHGMCCVETANVRRQSVTLGPGERTLMSVAIREEFSEG